MTKLSVGTLVTIKADAWREYLFRNGLDLDRLPPGPHAVLYMPAHPPYSDCVMLDFPFWWWKEDDIEIQD
jgi:hypothetical protein